MVAAVFMLLAFLATAAAEEAFGQCGGKTAPCSSEPIEAEGLSLLGTGKGVVAKGSLFPGRAAPAELPEDSLLETLLQEDDDASVSGAPEEQAETPTRGVTKGRPWRDVLWRPGDPSFYMSLCLDALIIAVVVHSVLRWRQCREEVAASPEALDLSGPSPGRRGLEPQRVQEFHKAVRAGDLGRCRELLSRTDPARLAEAPDVWGCTPLHVAAHVGSSTVAELLLEHGADPNAREAWDQTPLHFAAQSGSVKICQLLLSKGACIDAEDASDFTPLVLAAQAKQEATCEMLLARGAGVSGLSEAKLPAMLRSLLVKQVIAPTSVST